MTKIHVTSGRRLGVLCSVAAAVVVSVLSGRDSNTPLKVTVQWNRVESVSRLHGTVQLGPVKKNAPLHDQIIKALSDLGADFVRFQPWFPDPKYAVAELYPPEKGRTSWDFSLVDSPTQEFFNSVRGHPFMVNICTIPQWMYKTEKPVDPLKTTFDYEQGTDLRDPSMKEVGEYFARYASWYTQGGFKDEYGIWHESGHHFKIPYWEVLNEPDLEHDTFPERYTALYDTIVDAVRKVSPGTKFVGISLAFPRWEPNYFVYFLDHKNHRPGIPIDMITYHFYAFCRPDQSPDEQITTVFDQADQLLDTIRYIQAIRKRFSPETETDLNELGTGPAGWAHHDGNKQYLDFEFRLSTAMYAYLYGQMAGLEVDAAGLTGLGGGPPGGIFQELAMLDWPTGQPNIRYWGLKLLIDNFHPGDKLVSTALPSQSDIWPDFNAPRWQPAYVQGFVTRSGARKLLLVNKRDRDIALLIPGARGARYEFVDQTTMSHPASSSQSTSDTVTLRGLAEVVITFPEPATREGEKQGL